MVFRMIWRPDLSDQPGLFFYQQAGEIRDARKFYIAKAVFIEEGSICE